VTEKPRASTIVSRARTEADPAFGAIVSPIWTSDTFRWRDAESKPAYDYARTVNPNRDLLAQTLCELEGATSCSITNSGQSAALLVLLTLPVGARVIAPHDCYGGTYRLLQALNDQARLRVTFVDMLDDNAFARSIDGANLVWIESPSNPLLRITDIRKRSEQARAAGALTLADNTLSTPCRQRPLLLGCDLVMHSTTKAINGHSDLFGGAVLTADAHLGEHIKWWANAAGLSGSAIDAAQTLRGLRTLPIRIKQQERSATRLAYWLRDQVQIREVLYPGLESHPGNSLATSQAEGAGFVLSFRLAGGPKCVPRFLTGLQLITLASSLGGFSTLVCVPSTMTHRGMSLEAQLLAGIEPDLLRLSVGLEEASDLVADLAGALSGIP
jgi:cystathionine gamma-synthase